MSDALIGKEEREHERVLRAKLAHIRLLLARMPESADFLEERRKQSDRAKRLRAELAALEAPTEAQLAA